MSKQVVAESVTPAVDAIILGHCQHAIGTLDRSAGCHIYPVTITVLDFHCGNTVITGIQAETPSGGFRSIAVVTAITIRLFTGTFRKTFLVHHTIRNGNRRL
jgi:hypothetical protein